VFIIGEHGDSEVPVWSLANIAGMKLPDFCTAQGISYDSNDMDEIFRQTRAAAYQIIQRKGATSYAVAAGLMRSTQAILRNQNTVLSVSSLVQEALARSTSANDRHLEAGRLSNSFWTGQYLLYFPRV